MKSGFSPEAILIVRAATFLQRLLVSSSDRRSLVAGVLRRAGRLCIRTVGCGSADAPAIILALTIELDTPALPSEACCHFDQSMVCGLAGEQRRLRRADSWANQRETNVA